MPTHVRHTRTHDVTKRAASCAPVRLTGVPQRRVGEVHARKTSERSTRTEPAARQYPAASEWRQDGRPYLRAQGSCAAINNDGKNQSRRIAMRNVRTFTAVITVAICSPLFVSGLAVADQPANSVTSTSKRKCVTLSKKGTKINCKFVGKQGDTGPQGAAG